MIDDIIIIRYLPIDDRIKKELYIDLFIENKYKVHYWDMSIFFFPNQFKENKQESFVIKIESYNHLIKLIEHHNLNTSIFITDITFRGIAIKLFKILTKKKCYLVFFAKSPVVSSHSVKQSFDNKILRYKTLLNKLLSPKELKRFFGDRLSIFYKKIGLIKPYDLIFTIGKYGIHTVGKGWQMDAKYSKLCNINSRDYDNFLHEVNNSSEPSKNYCVFLDQYYPFHPDFIVTKQNPINAAKYYESINILFERLKDIYKIEVKIAAHPKAVKYKNKNFFNENEVLFDKTTELVKNSDFVIAHNSTSISYAVLYNKPLLFITSNDFKYEMPGSHSSTISFAKELNGTLINLDSYNIEDITFSINKKSYSGYKYKYLTSPKSEHNNSSDIIIKTLKSLL